MPKKTKREKQLADARRKRGVSVSGISAVMTADGAPQQAKGYTFHAESSVQKRTDAVTESTELTAIRTDLTKTITLALVAIAIELVLYARGFIK